MPLTLDSCNGNRKAAVIGGEKRNKEGRNNSVGGSILVGAGGVYYFPKLWERKCLDLEDERGLHLQWSRDKSCVESMQTPQQPWIGM